MTDKDQTIEILEALKKSLHDAVKKYGIDKCQDAIYNQGKTKSKENSNSFRRSFDTSSFIRTLTRRIRFDTKLKIFD